ncbi:MAG TPA: alpha/beta fold hydrolase [Candidatus Thermoplasmatota archaeon]|nr:alpha/beta fold hydrolase [Candidatus Thermoplasmatota archaeon]
MAPDGGIAKAFTGPFVQGLLSCKRGVAILAALLAGCLQDAPSPPAPEPDAVAFLLVPSEDGHGVPVTVYRPPGASSLDPAPVVLHTHGWGGSRETRLEAFREFLDAGLGVVSMDMRGHGEARATSQSRLASPAYELADVRAVVDAVAALPWVRLDAAGDPRVAAMGESYGGAVSLLAAALDPRIDAVAAKDTWNDLAHALAPGGVPKTAFIASLWLSAAAQARLHPDVRGGFEAAVRQGALPESVHLPFARSSPAAYPEGIRAPTLLLQGVNDTLFDLGQALANHDLVARTGAPATLVAHLGGHSLGDRPRPRQPDPCGEPNTLAVAWLRAHLGGEEASMPAVCLALDDGTVLRGTAALWDRPPVAVEAGALSIRPGDLASRDATPLLSARNDTAVVGAPGLSGTAPAGANGTVFWWLEAVAPGGQARRANGQSHPMRLAGGPFETELAPVALRLREGEALRLVVASHDPLFATPRGVEPQPWRLEGLKVRLPIACQGPGCAYST